MPAKSKITTITSQIQNVNQPIEIFENLQQAKDWFYKSSAQKCSEDYCSRVEYALILDENGENTRLKRTEEWPLDGSAQLYNERKIELIKKNKWGNNIPYEHTTSEDHLF